MSRTERKSRHIQPAQLKQMEMTERARYVQENEAKTKTRKDSQGMASVVLIHCVNHWQMNVLQHEIFLLSDW